MDEFYNRPIKTIALIGKPGSHEIIEPLIALSACLREKGVKVLVEESAAALLDNALSHADAVADYATLGAEANVAIVVGGDGTMLDAARRLAACGVPLVGVNVGRVGFMTDLSRLEIQTGIDELLSGKLLVERRFLLEVTITRDTEVVCSALAFNDVVVNKGEIGRMIELEVKVDDEFLYVLRADGMIVSTPTGSTAYALSANGPILHPSVPGIAIVPLCPHALSNRPITIPDRSVVELLLLPPHDARVHFDGQGMFDTRAGDCVRVTRAPHTVTLLHPQGYSYFAMLREKLHWSSAPRGS
ncbi:MAG: NAD(+)/NADH kinase [Georgfuchsia sp.]